MAKQKRKLVKIIKPLSALTQDESNVGPEFAAWLADTGLWQPTKGFYDLHELHCLIDDLGTATLGKLIIQYTKSRS